MRGGIKSVHVVVAIVLFVHSHSQRHFSLHMCALPLFFFCRCRVLVGLNELLLFFSVHKGRRLTIKIAFSARKELVGGRIIGVIILT